MFDANHDVFNIDGFNPASGTRTIRAELWNQTGASLQLGEIAIIDFDGLSTVANGATTEPSLAVDLHDAQHPFNRVVGTHAGAGTDSLARYPVMAACEETTLANGAKGTFLLQGMSTLGVLCHVEAADAALLSLTTGTPGIHVFAVSINDEGRCAARATQSSAADHQSKGIFLPKTYGGDDTDYLAEGLFLGIGFGFGFTHA